MSINDEAISWNRLGILNSDALLGLVSRYQETLRTFGSSDCRRSPLISQGDRIGGGSQMPPPASMTSTSCYIRLPERQCPTEGRHRKYKNVPCHPEQDDREEVDVNPESSGKNYLGS